MSRTAPVHAHGAPLLQLSKPGALAAAHALLESLPVRASPAPLPAQACHPCTPAPPRRSLFRNLEEVEKLSELGVLFLLFEMGLELSIDRLRVRCCCAAWRWIAMA